MSWSTPAWQSSSAWHPTARFIAWRHASTGIQPAQDKMQMLSICSAGWCERCSSVCVSAKMHAARDVFKRSPEDKCFSAQAVFYHKASRTLLVTDAAVYISSNPPEVLLLLQDMSNRCCMPCCWEAHFSLSRPVLTTRSHGSVQQLCVLENTIQGH